MDEKLKRENEAVDTSGAIPPPPQRILPSGAQGPRMMAAGGVAPNAQDAGVQHTFPGNTGEQASLEGARRPSMGEPGVNEQGLVHAGGERVMGLGVEDVRKALETMRKYHAGKASVENRVISSQNWWKLRNWAEADPDSGMTDHRPNSAWLWNCIVGKHADAMSAFPEPVVLPRMMDDRDTAKKLSDIIPVVLQQNDFEEVYSDCSWQKMLEGTGVYGVFWDKSRNGGLGDIAIKRVDVLNLFWEPGVTDIQDSANLFSCTLMDNDQVEAQWPQMRGVTKTASVTINKYMFDDNVDTTDKSLIIDWYYKRTTPEGRTLLHYAKLCGNTVLFASENDPEMAMRGFYDDGLYPFVFDRLFPVQGSPCGYGYIDVGKDTQETIDKLNAALTSNAIMSATPRYFVRKDGSVNEAEFADWRKPLVHVDGNLAEDSLRQIVVNGMDSYVLQQLQASVEELKFVTGNMDVANGTTGGGVTAASAIAALQETAGRSSKDSSKSAYRAYSRLVTMVIERIRQFYDIPRTFRILGQMGQEQYVQMGNEALLPQSQGIDFGIDMGYRLPVFDVEVHAQKESPYTQLSQNELALQFFQLGFFNPQMVDQSLIAIDMMEFKGKDELAQKIQQLGGMQQMIQQLGGIALQLASQYEPALAQQLSQILMGQQAALSGQPASAQQALTEDAQTEDQKRSSTITEGAKQKAAEATAPQ